MNTWNEQRWEEALLTARAGAGAGLLWQEVEITDGWKKQPVTNNPGARSACENTPAGEAQRRGLCGRGFSCWRPVILTVVHVTSQLPFAARPAEGGGSAQLTLLSHLGVARILPHRLQLSACQGLVMTQQNRATLDETSKETASLQKAA